MFETIGNNNETDTNWSITDHQTATKVAFEASVYEFEAACIDSPQSRRFSDDGTSTRLRLDGH